MQRQRPSVTRRSVQHGIQLRSPDRSVPSHLAYLGCALTRPACNELWTHSPTLVSVYRALQAMLILNKRSISSRWLVLSFTHFELTHKSLLPSTVGYLLTPLRQFLVAIPLPLTLQHFNLHPYHSTSFHATLYQHKTDLHPFIRCHAHAAPTSESSASRGQLDVLAILAQAVNSKDSLLGPRVLQPLRPERTLTTRCNGDLANSQRLQSIMVLFRAFPVYLRPLLPTHLLSLTCLINQCRQVT